MPRGMRIISGREAQMMSSVTDTLRSIALEYGLEEIILPSVWEQQTFIDKAGPEILNQMYIFDDKAGRPLCLIPEVTALVQDWYKSQQNQPKIVFYVNRCYRYERPQAGRYREFTQFGVEFLGPNPDQDALKELGRSMVGQILGKTPWTMNDSVKRGLSYYVENGFEVEVSSLGAQKQVLGGGRYKEGAGFAIGIDRLVLACDTIST